MNKSRFEFRIRTTTTTTMMMSSYGSRRRRRRSSVAPASTPAAWVLQQSFGLNEKVGKGKLLGGGGEMVKATDPEYSTTTFSSFTTALKELLKVLLLVLFTGRFFGSGHNGLLPEEMTFGGDDDTGTTFATVFTGFRFSSFFLGLVVVFGFDFLGVRDESRFLLLLLFSNVLLVGGVGHERPLQIPFEELLKF